MTIAALVPASLLAIARLSQGGDPRIQKTRHGLEALTRGVDTVGLGARKADILSVDDPNQQFSDDGWVQMPLSVGVPLTLAVVVNSWFALRTRRRRRIPWRERGTLLIFIGTILLNNANLWDPWLISIFAAYWIVRYADPTDYAPLDGTSSESALSPTALQPRGEAETHPVGN
ncbi:MAG: hypothetical protein ACXVJY_16820 [Ilumatobacteraceae bacterium]